jgi:SulP family sulfate permease
VHALTLAFIILFLAPLASNIPLASLAAILFVTAYNMSDHRHFLRMVRRAPRADVAILLITFLLTVFADLVVAVNIGVILATLHFLRRMSASVEVQQLDQSYVASMQAVYQNLKDLPKEVVVYSIDGPFFFGAVENFEQALEQTHTMPRVVILRLHRVPFADITGLQTLQEVAEKLRRKGATVLLCEANERMLEKLQRVGAIGGPSGADCCADFPSAVSRARELLAAAPATG